MDLKKLRKKHRLTQQQVAAAIGTTQGHISRIENGKVTGKFKDSFYYRVVDLYKPFITTQLPPIRIEDIERVGHQEVKNDWHILGWAFVVIALFILTM